MKKIEYLKELMDDADKKRIGEEIKYVEGLNEQQKYAVWNNIVIPSPIEKLDENNYLYVVSPDGMLYIVPSVYKEALAECYFENAYFSDQLPIFSKVEISSYGINGSIYFVESHVEQHIFLNDNAAKILKSLYPLEIKDILKGKKGTPRSRF